MDPFFYIQAQAITVANRLKDNKQHYYFNQKYLKSDKVKMLLIIVISELYQPSPKDQNDKRHKNIYTPLIPLSYTSTHSNLL